MHAIIFKFKQECKVVSCKQVISVLGQLYMNKDFYQKLYMRYGVS